MVEHDRRETDLEVQHDRRETDLVVEHDSLVLIT